MIQNKKMSIMRIVCMALVLATVLSMIPALNASATSNYNGGFTMSGSRAMTVWEDESCLNKVGTIYAYEGYTILNLAGNGAFVQYSSPSGMKEGYIYDPDYSADSVNKTAVARVTTSSQLYYGPNGSSYVNSGSVNANELVVVLASDYNWSYIEYNTNSGRKRGYIENSKLSWYKYPSGMETLPTNQYASNHYVDITKTTTVYAGPSDVYPSVGSVGTSDGRVYYYGNPIVVNNTQYVYIQYTQTSSGKLKSGFIKR